MQHCDIILFTSKTKKGVFYAELRTSWSAEQSVATTKSKFLKKSSLFLEISSLSAATCTIGLSCWAHCREDSARYSKIKGGVAILQTTGILTKIGLRYEEFNPLCSYISVIAFSIFPIVFSYCIYVLLYFLQCWLK